MILAGLFMLAHQSVAILTNRNFRNDAGLAVPIDSQLVQKNCFLITTLVGATGQQVLQLIHVFF